jgi:tetratricopeptide (TPR) repeat protein
VALIVFLVFPTVALPQQPKQPSKGQPAKQTPPVHPLQALLEEADAGMKREDWAAAAEALQKYLVEKPEDGMAQFQLGYCFSAMRKWPEAEAAYRRAIAFVPQFAEAYQNLGALLLRERLAEEGISFLRKAAELKPDSAQPFFLLGVAFASHGRPAEAVEAFRAAAQRDPKSYSIQLSLGQALLDVKNAIEAEGAFRQAMALSSRAAEQLEAQAWLARALVLQSKLSDAAAVLETLLLQEPTNGVAWLDLAQVRLGLKRYDAALEALDKAARYGAQAVGVARLRADAYQAQKRYPEAAQALSEVVAAQPANAELHARLGRLLLQQREFPAAEGELKKALELDPEAVEPLGDLVSVYYLAERYDVALRALDLLARRQTPGAGHWFIRATCYDKLGQKPEALAAYEKFLELDQGRSDKQGFQARQRIKILQRELKKN